MIRHPSTHFLNRGYAPEHSFAGPAAWNTLPSSVQELSDTESFKRHLKTVLFSDVTAAVVSFSFLFLLFLTL